MKLISLSLAALLLCIFIACNNKSKKSNADIAEFQLVKQEKQEEMMKEPIAGDLRKELAADTVSAPAGNKPNQNQPAGKADTKEDWDKKIIKNGNLSLEVKNYQAFNELVRTTVKKLGGYIAQEQQNQSDYKIENNAVLNVPVDQFDNAMQLLTPPGEKVTNKKITSEDVTATLIDTKARMEAKKKVRDRYLDFLKQAKNMEEILRVQQEVNEVQETIEAAAGRVNYLGHAAAFSTIHINYYQVLTALPDAVPPPSYGLRIITSFKSGLQWFAELFIVLVTLWPVWAGITVAWFLIKRIKLSPVKKS